MKIYVTGVSGTGKTSVAKALTTEGITAIDIDYLSHWEHAQTGERTGWEPGASDEWHESHVWLCDISELKKTLKGTQNIAVVGYASNQAEYIELFDKIFVLSVGSRTLEQRLKGRGAEDFGTHPAERARVLNWQKTFDDEMVAKGAIRIDAEQPLEKVVGEICSSFD